MPHFTAPDGARLFYRDEGAGRAVVCLAGLTRTGADFDPLVPHLPGLRVIRPDYRGRGGSDRTGPDTYTVPQEGADVRALLDHLGIDRAAVIGTSRGGIIGMFLAATAHDRLAGLCLNDVGPVLEDAGLAAIRGHLGRPPAARTLHDAAEAMARRMTGFTGVPHARWLAEAERQFIETPDGLELRYDPALRDAFEAAMAQPVDMWPLFDACAGLPLALIRGANSDLLTAATAAEMQRRRPDMILAEVPGRGHIPFLDEPESLAAIHRFLEASL
ncbi:alpha/beta fold hydrolase [Rhodobaculum claviforme]|uniref:Alpha/beta hydrolase n=1 Tax=Rhodobaculum claviforme TaxID=1549854 RepID=A0A934TKF2_9RHOB|nr:alpha/beta hydrolase [Rhodobaculum claviforme]MBK5927754.1 alpha/beta hydrolase [Rhodobaculum claviforme]